MPETSPSFGAYLRERRARVDPSALGIAPSRRRTPGLRREEVAARAGISATWYGWLEQGRGGAPSAGALHRIAGALLLSDAEREHLFLLGLGRPPEPRYHPPGDVAPRLQRVLDALTESPALILTATWDVVAWNAAAAAVLTDYGERPPGRRNVLRMLFLEDGPRRRNRDWEGVARYVVGVFRRDAARAGAAETIAPFVEELAAESPLFARLWGEGEVEAHGDGMKRIDLPGGGGEVAFEFSSFAVDGRPDLTMIVYNPLTPEDAAAVRAVTPRSRTTPNA